jgi:hypothetical protein
MCIDDNPVLQALCGSAHLCGSALRKHQLEMRRLVFLVEETARRSDIAVESISTQHGQRISLRRAMRWDIACHESDRGEE